MKSFALILFIALVGCGKKSDAPPAVAVEEQPAAAAPAPVVQEPAPEPTASPAPRRAVAIDDQLHGAVHPEMTMRLQMFNQMKGRLPENFYELQNMPGFDTVPGLPANMKYEIDPKDKTVKVVKK